MAEKIAFENGRISNFEGLVTLTLDRVILHTVVCHLSTSRLLPTCQISLKSKKYVDGRTDGRTDVRTYALTDGHLRPTVLGRLNKVSPPRRLSPDVSAICLDD